MKSKNQKSAAPRAKRESKSKEPTGTLSAPKLSRSSVPTLGKHASLRGSPIQYAPAAVSSGTGVRFTNLSGDFNRGIKVHMRVPFCQIVNDTSTFNATAGRPCLGMSSSLDGSTTIQASWSGVGFSPSRYCVQRPTAGTSSPGYFDMGVGHPPCVHTTLLSTAFSRFRHTSDIRFTYEPGLNTDNSLQFRLQWTSDAANPVYGLASTSQRVLQLYDVDDTPNCVVGAGWAPFVWDVPMPCGDFYLYAAPVYVSGGTTGGYDTSLLRNSFSGLLSGCATRYDGGGDFTAGILFAEYTMEFFDPLPVAASIGLTLSGGRADAVDEDVKVPDKKDEKESAPDEFVSIAAPPLLGPRPTGGLHPVGAAVSVLRRT